MKQKALIFLSIYILALLAPVAMLVEFAIYQEEIAEEFCENKDKPKLKCEGKCHLAKMLSDQSQQDEEENTFDSSFEYPVGKVGILRLKNAAFSNALTSDFFYLKRSLSAHLNLIEHPPRV